MKTSVLVLSAVLAMAAGVRAHAGEPDAARWPYFAVPTDANVKNIARIAKNYASALASANDGAVESALAQVAYIGLWKTETRFDDLNKGIEFLIVSGRTPAIRFEASLARVALDSPELFASARKAEYSSGEEFFAELSTTLQKTLLGYNERERSR